MSLKRLPLSVSDFRKLQEDDYIYVDKTKQIYDVLKSGEAFFLSRPRRFGKSLTISTLNELFKNRKELFKNTWIYNSDWKWREYAIIRLDFSSIDFDTKASFEHSLSGRLDDIAQRYKFSLEKKLSIKDKTQFLLEQLSIVNPVAILIDEYDAPLLKYIDKPQFMEEMKEILQAFYATIKANNHLVSYLFITGITRFAKMSVFSGMNNLNDLSFDISTANLCGYTQEELEVNYHDHLVLLAQQEEITLPALLNKIKYWYNGYRFSEKDETIYNPFSIVSLCIKKKFYNYWYDSGSPSYLMKLLKNHYSGDFEIGGAYHQARYLQSAITPENNIDFTPLLLQAGYLTITDYKKGDDVFKLDYPNFECKEAFSILILAFYANKADSAIATNILYLKQSLQTLDFKSFFTSLENLISSIAYMNREKSEKYYSSMVHLTLKLLQLNVTSEVQTHTGRIDTVVEMKNHIFIFEYKFNGTAQDALDQIKTKKYYAPYVDSGKQIVLIGISFNYIERKDGAKTGPTFDIEWKTETNL